MSAVIINPGTWDVRGKRPCAIANMLVLIRDAELENSWLEFPIGKDARTDTGRFVFDVRFKKKRCRVEMPGLKLAAVRWMDRSEQNIMQFPRLYVAGNSWVWFFAIGALRDELG